MRFRRLSAATVAFAVFLTGCSSPATGPGLATPPATPTSATPATVPVAAFSGCPAPGAAVDVCNGTFDITAWVTGPPDPQDPCPVGKTTLANGLYPNADGNKNNGVIKFVVADVNRDGVADAIVLLSCQIGDPPMQQVMVVGGTSGGGLRTLGPVVGPARGQIEFVEDVAADADGSFRALVVARHGSTGGQLALRQWRTYNWDGAQFAQTAGSTSFKADPSAAKLTASATPLVFAPAQGGQRRANFTLTVRNTGTTVAKGVSVHVLLEIASALKLTSADCPVGPLVKAPTCAAGDLAAGASRTFSLSASISADDAQYFLENQPDGRPGKLRIVVGDQEYSSTTMPKVTFR